MNRYLITYESAHWCGAADTKCVVYAEDELTAVIVAEPHMEEEMRELFSEEYGDAVDEYEEESSYDQECAYSITSVELFDEKHEDWKYYVHETQSQFYPVVNRL